MKTEKQLINLSNYRHIKKAIDLAKSFHAGQVRKGPNGEAFFNHPRRVCKCYLRYKNKTVWGMVASLCHDLVEDTPVSLEKLEELFGEEVRQIVLDLTKPGNVSSERYAEMIGSWGLESKKIKLCDIEDNIRSSRFLQREQRTRMLIRWRKYLNQLETRQPGDMPGENEFLQKWKAVNDLHHREWQGLTTGPV